MSILFVNASPNPRGTTARLAAQLLAGKSYDTIELGTTKVYDYGQDFADDRFDEVADAMRAADTIVFGSPVYWHSFSGMLRNLIDRCYGTMEGQLDGKRLFFILQGSAPTKEQLYTAEWTMERFAGLYRMRYEGMASNAAEATALARRV
jgi:multimeric flavodoxin WrbA